MASKMKSNILTMSLSLLIVATVSSALLSYVFKLTKEPIEIANNKKKVEALSLVLPEFDNSPIDETIKVPTDGDSIICYIGKKGEKIIGVAFESYTNKGFGGHFDVMVGFTPDGTIYNTMMLEHHETPGLGDKTEKEKSNWTDQFKGKNPSIFTLKVKKDGGKVDAITAATITSRAYSDAIQRAYDSFEKYVKKDIQK